MFFFSYYAFIISHCNYFFFSGLFNLIVCAFFSLAPVLKAISVGGRATSHSYLDQEGLRAGFFRTSSRV